MATSFLQKLRLALRGWSRRRDEEAKRREGEFLAKNMNWGKPAVEAPPPRAARPAPVSFDLEGLQVAYLDDSGQIAYYLDRESGEVIEVRPGEAAPAGDRYPRVPARSAQSDEADRRAFAAEHDSLAASVGDAGAFRRALAADRTLEKAWYRFKNDRATAAIASWLKTL